MREMARGGGKHVGGLKEVMCTKGFALLLNCQSEI